MKSTFNVVGKTYFHGGVAGLTVGDFIKPASRLGLSYEYTRDAKYNPDNVYVTPTPEFARSFAAKAVGRLGQPLDGAIYEVQVRGPLMNDPDFGDGLSYMTPYNARIVKVVEPYVAFSKVESLRHVAEYMSWVGGGPMYDPDGYLLPSPAMREAGVTAEYLRLLGPWIYHDEVDSQGVPAKMGATPQETILQNFHGLDQQHRILCLAHHPRWWGRILFPGPCYACSCGRRPRDKHEAVLHQMGQEGLLLICRRMGWPLTGGEEASWRAFLEDLGSAAKQLTPDRWSWFRPQTP